MSASNDFSRRLFADFVATRIKAHAMQAGGARPLRRGGAARAEGIPARLDPGASGTPPIDRPRGLIPGLGSTGR
jgi:hypothetical protein